jgi:hypothetical protein
VASGPQPSICIIWEDLVSLVPSYNSPENRVPIKIFPIPWISSQKLNKNFFSYWKLP